MFFAASCGQKPDSTKTKTIVFEDFASNPTAKINYKEFANEQTGTGKSVFLPAQGIRSSDGTLNLVGMQGNYWTSTTSCSDCSYGM